MTDDSPHFERMMVGFGWIFMALIMASIFEESGFSFVESAIAGFAAVPLLVIAVYLAGVVGYWVINVTDAERRLSK